MRLGAIAAGKASRSLRAFRFAEYHLRSCLGLGVGMDRLQRGPFYNCRREKYHKTGEKLPEVAGGLMSFHH